MAACKDASVSEDATVEEVLALLSKGSFRCRPCSHCKNSDPFQLELTQKDPGQPGSSRCLLCKKCQKPYNMDKDDDDDDGDDDDGQPRHSDSGLIVTDGASSFSGTECRNCQNKEKDLFSVTLSENGQPSSVQCLVCYHRVTSRDDDDKDPEFSEWIECSRCPNRTRDLFRVTPRDDGSGRIHTITCLSCGHGNTLHDPGDSQRRGSQPREETGSVQQQRQPWGAGVWNALGNAYSVVAPSIQKSIQWAAGRGIQQAAGAGAGAGVGAGAGAGAGERGVQNHRPVPENLRQMGVRLLRSVGEDVVVHLGNRFLRNFVSSAVIRDVAVNVGKFIESQAAVKLEETQKAKKKNDQ